MALYEYRCEACGQRFEVIQRFSDPPPAQCTKCGGGPVERLLSSPAIQFKGTGWYVTDYAQKGKASGDTSSKDGPDTATPAAEKKGDGDSADAKGDGAKADTATADSTKAGSSTKESSKTSGA